MRIKRLLTSRDEVRSFDMVRVAIAAVIIVAIGGVVGSIAYGESKLNEAALFHPQEGYSLVPNSAALARQFQLGQTAQSARPVIVAGDVMAGQVTSRVNPAYPTDAKAARIQGVVKLKVIVTKDGSVHKAQVISGPKELYRSSIVAVSQWKYKPYLLNGKPVDVETIVNINYALRS